MSATNVDYYCAGFDANGKRVGSIICDFDPEKEKNKDKDKDKVNALIEQGKSIFNEAVTVEIINADDYCKYVSGDYIRGTDGAPTKYVAPEPTAEEKAVAEKASLAAEYASNKADMMDALQSATLAGNTAAIASIQQDYKEMTEAYKVAVEGVTAK